MITLDGHTALVTGSTHGVGRAIAEAFAQAGADIVLHGLRDDDAAKQALDACKTTGRNCGIVFCDLSDQIGSSTKYLFERATDKHSKIDILVNNAGSYFDKPFLEMDMESYERTMRLNVEAAYFLTQQFARHWVQHRVQGRVLMTGSINGRLAEQNHTAYDTSKGAIEMMVKSLCVALAPYGIRVNGVAPGLVRTPLTESAISNEKFRKWMELHTPAGSIPQPEVCAGAAVYLASDMAVHVHGHMLLVDGGMSAWQQPDLPNDDWINS